ncbi:MAG TPA: TauD/TfdA family dioxygenase [Longimicrobiaceae bacterium]|nr:TauD/TfdA family dioxygenase [Longimicrobiaceae bacterium]
MVAVTTPQAPTFGPVTKDDLYGAEIDGAGKSVEEIATEAKERFPAHHAVYVRNFPTQPDAYIGFLSCFGEPLPNYGSKSGVESYQLHPCINQVRYIERDGGGKFVHERGGPLYAHSARSWRKDRPPYFSMLMVEPGWRDEPEGSNGESIMVRWRDVLRLMRSRDPEQAEAAISLLSQTPISFPANNVVEEISDLPLIYPLHDAEDADDVGVRLKVDIMQKTELIREQVPDFDAYMGALSRFYEAANDPAVCASYSMDGGDLVLVDNNRFGHGRRSIVSAREENGERKLNPRELWSVTVG